MFLRILHFCWVQNHMVKTRVFSILVQRIFLQSLPLLEWLFLNDFSQACLTSQGTTNTHFHLAKYHPKRYDALFLNRNSMLNDQEKCYCSWKAGASEVRCIELSLALRLQHHCCLEFPVNSQTEYETQRLRGEHGHSHQVTLGHSFSPVQLV